MKSHFLGIRTCPACQTSARVSKLRVEIENETDKRLFLESRMRKKFLREMLSVRIKNDSLSLRKEIESEVCITLN